MFYWRDHFKNRSASFFTMALTSNNGPLIGFHMVCMQPQLFTLLPKKHLRRNECVHLNMRGKEILSVVPPHVFH